MSRRAIWIGLFVSAAAWFSLSEIAQGGQGRGGAAAAPPSPYPVTAGRAYRFEKVADGVFYATSAGSMVTGSNNIVIVGDRDVMVVDTGTSPAAARAMIDDLKSITSNPVRHVVNSHFHYDHTDGNQIYAAAKADIYAHDYVKYAIEKLDVLHREPFQTSQLTNVPNRLENLKKQIAEEKDSARKATLQGQLDVAQKGWEELKEITPTPPNKTYSKQMNLKVGQHDVQLLFLGRGHTNGDTFVYLPKERVICTGDMLETAPSYMGDGQFDEWIASLEALKKLDFDTILPGHGRVMTGKTIISAYQSYLKDLIDQVAALRKQGLTAEQAAERVDLTSHKADYPNIQRPGADLRGVRRMYAWMDERGRK